MHLVSEGFSGESQMMRLWCNTWISSSLVGWQCGGIGMVELCWMKQLTGSMSLDLFSLLPVQCEWGRPSFICSCYQELLHKCRGLRDNRTIGWTPTPLMEYMLLFSFYASRNHIHSPVPLSRYYRASEERGYPEDRLGSVEQRPLPSGKLWWGTLQRPLLSLSKLGHFFIAFIHLFNPVWTLFCFVFESGFLCVTLAVWNSLGRPGCPQNSICLSLPSALPHHRLFSCIAGLQESCSPWFLALWFPTTLSTLFLFCLCSVYLKSYDLGRVCILLIALEYVRAFVFSRKTGSLYCSNC